METAPLKAFATKARTGLIKEIAGRISVVLTENSLARVEAASAVSALEKAIARDGLDRVTDQVAYTWFNRIIALRFMDANGYTDSGIVSPAGGQSNGQPEVLAEAKAGVFDDAIVPKTAQDSITALFNGTRASQDRDGEAYGLLLEAYCRAWNGAMPFMFEREGDYTELLIPTALLAADSVRDRAVKTLTEEVCREVEVIGWLYQFYISDRKDEVFEGFKKNKKAGAAEIPAATQLFTPHWIVRYLVENSLGRLWLLNNPSSRLGEQMDYYITPVDEETDFLRIAKPEELKVLDPAVGSGHMLTYAFDLLYAIYAERGYDPAEVPGLILEHNLYGVEIDPRAGALAAFALTMKAAAKRKLFLKHPVQPNIRVLQNVHFDEAELDYLWSLTKAEGFARVDADEFWNAFEHADTLGSLIQPKEQLVEPRKVTIEGVSADGDLLHGATIEKAGTVIKQAEYLSRRYAIVVANPPYMGGKNMGAKLRECVEQIYPDAKADLFSAFSVRALGLLDQLGVMGLMTPNTWLYISAHKALRTNRLGPRLLTLVELPLGGFDGATIQVCAFVVGSTENRSQSSFFRLVDQVGGPSEMERILAKAIADSESSIRFTARPDSFSSVPGGPIVYWFPSAMFELFSNSPSLKGIASASIGMITGANAEYVRDWREVSYGRISIESASRDEARLSGARWFPYAKGGDFRRWAGNVESVVDWENDGTRLQKTTTPDGKRIRGHNFNLDRIFRPGLVWTTVTSGPQSFRYVRRGHLFDSAAGICQSSDDLYVLALLNSQAAADVLSGLNPTLNLPPGYLESVPAPKDAHASSVAELASHAVELSEADWRSKERSWGFERSPLLRNLSRLSDSYEDLRSESASILAKLAEIEAAIDRHFDALYGIQTRRKSSKPRSLSLSLNPAYAFPGIADHAREPLHRAETIRELVSYSVGCMFGRYSLDKPGLILADQGSTLEEYLAQVPTPSFLPDRDNVIPIIDGDWFEDDIVARFRQFLRAAFGDKHFEENLGFVTESLGVKDIRDYFVKSFYDDHVKRYKKRPIYWLFRSPKGSFSALIYLHRYSPSTVSTVLTGYLREFIGKLETNLDHQGRVAAGMGGASARDIANAQKEAERIRKVLVELRDYEHDILFPLAGQQIALDLDDGVLVNYQKLGPALKDIGLKKGNSSE
jgi:hypothetical protein